MKRSLCGVGRICQRILPKAHASQWMWKEKWKAWSVHAAPSVSVQELTAPNPHTGYPGIPHNQVGVTTVGAIRAAGGDVVSAPTRTNPYHATLSGLTPEQASQLFCPTVKNPNTRTRVVE